MSKVKFPTITVRHNTARNRQRPLDVQRIAPDSLMAYLGVRGLGTADESQGDLISRTFNAVPILAYYDIFEQYYANKQEDNAFVIGANTSTEANITELQRFRAENGTGTWTKFDPKTDSIEIKKNDLLVLKGKNLDFNEIKFNTTNATDIAAATPTPINTATEVQFKVKGTFATTTYTANQIGQVGGFIETGVITLNEFPLKNIDDMRTAILRNTELGATFDIGNDDMLPYQQLYEITSIGNSYNYFNLNGLCVKTYQSDIFNNWINTEWLDGENGINAITAVSTAGDEFTIDSLNLAKKVYDMLNRIALSGGTYEDWQEVNYGEQALRRAESPIYQGGMSSEIVFEELVSTAETTDKPLGTGRNDYKRFILESGAGDVSAYFKGVGPDDYLTPGGTYKVIYPYASVVNYYDRNNGCYVAELSQPSSDASHLSDYDWLFSVSKTIPNDNTMPSFLLQHAFSLIKINLTVSNYTGALRYLQSMSISSNGYNFAESVYWNDNLDFTIAENSEKIGISYSA